MRYLPIFLILFFAACNIKPINPQKKIVKAHQPYIKNFADSLKYFGRNESRTFNNRSPSDSKFPNEQTHYVKVYELDCMRECPFAVFTNRIDNGQKIIIQEYEKLLQILNDSTSYGQAVASCHYPKIGVIAYNNNNEPLEWIDICLDCNRFMSKPVYHEIPIKVRHHYGFSYDGRDQLKVLFKSWGIAYGKEKGMFDRGWKPTDYYP